MSYIPRAFQIEETGAAHRLIADNSFGLLIAPAGDGIEVSHLPFILDTDRGDLGHLRCHVARANPIWRALEGGPVTAVFSGPHAYISPDWYATPNLVPTWNYTAAYVQGVGRIMAEEDLRRLLVDLTASEETRIAGKAPWSVSSVPETALAPMYKAIVGIDIAITRIDGKSKMSQNRTEADRKGVVSALRAQGGGDAKAVADLVDLVTG
jgi:transcriptional regulator